MLAYAPLGKIIPKGLIKKTLVLYRKWFGRLS